MVRPQGFPVPAAPLVGLRRRTRRPNRAAEAIARSTRCRRRPHRRAWLAGTHVGGRPVSALPPRTRRLAPVVRSYTSPSTGMHGGPATGSTRSTAPQRPERAWLERPNVERGHGIYAVLDHATEPQERLLVYRFGSRQFPRRGSCSCGRRSRFDSRRIGCSRMPTRSGAPLEGESGRPSLPRLGSHRPRLREMRERDGFRVRPIGRRTVSSSLHHLKYFGRC